MSANQNPKAIHPVTADIEALHPDEVLFTAPQTEALIAELARLKPMDYEQRRERKAKALGVRVSVLDKAVEAQRPKSPDDASVDPFEAVEDWGECVDGADLLANIQAAILRFCVLPQGKPQADTINLVRALTALQPVPGPPETEPPFLRSPFESCEREMLRPSRRKISPARRDNVQFRRSSTGADRSAAATLRAACALNGTGPGAMRALRASTPTRAKSLRQSRTRILAHPEGLRDPKACAIRALVQPSSVTSSARALSASARSAQ
jgi:hypothetical protein